MKKTEVITKVQEIANAKVDGAKFTKKEIAAVVDALGEAIVDAVRAGESVKVNDVTYKAKDVAERSGVIQLGDRKGETWTTPAHKSVTVKASKSLKEALM